MLKTFIIGLLLYTCISYQCSTKICGLSTKEYRFIVQLGESDIEYFEKWQGEIRRGFLVVVHHQESVLSHIRASVEVSSKGSILDSTLRVKRDGKPIKPTSVQRKKIIRAASNFSDYYRSASLIYVRSFPGSQNCTEYRFSSGRRVIYGKMNECSQKVKHLVRFRQCQIDSSWTAYLPQE